MNTDVKVRGLRGYGSGGGGEDEGGGGKGGGSDHASHHRLGDPHGLGFYRRIAECCPPQVICEALGVYP